LGSEEGIIGREEEEGRREVVGVVETERVGVSVSVVGAVNGSVDTGDGSYRLTACDKLLNEERLET
jgi:hypothetical protein